MGMFSHIEEFKNIAFKHYFICIYLKNCYIRILNNHDHQKKLLLFLTTQDFQIPQYNINLSFQQR